ncbi:MAG: CCC motif membrane protein [Bacteroidales bacterium]|nr:CCC motif membrane protein [Bacteroidales bacterium]MDD4669642.1 CCC motif membrane protein [Bacteroidales bacterium]
MEIIEPRRQQLPNTTTVLVLGILSLVLNGLIGLILGIIGASLASRGMTLYNENPDAYFGYGQLNAGRVMSIIGIVKNVVCVIAVIVMLSLFGTAMFAAIASSF